MRKGCYYLVNEAGKRVLADFNGIVFVLSRNTPTAEEVTTLKNQILTAFS
jgi:hypothetical protein